MGNKTSVGNEKWSDEEVRNTYDMMNFVYGKCYYRGKVYKSDLQIFRTSLTRCHLPPTDPSRRELEAAINATNSDFGWTRIARMACNAPEMKKRHDDYVSQIQPLKFHSHSLYNKCLEETGYTFASYTSTSTRSDCINMADTIKKLRESQ